jgi:hypothetical protein
MNAEDAMECSDCGEEETGWKAPCKLGYLPRKDRKESPMSERSFLAGGTERIFVFEPPMEKLTVIPPCGKRVECLE